MKKNNPRIHKEWFQSIVKRSCPCGQKKVEMFAWGEYVFGKWRTVDHFCKSCFLTNIVPQLLSHAKECGCSFQLQARVGHRLPEWLKMPDVCEVKEAS